MHTSLVHWPRPLFLASFVRLQRLPIETCPSHARIVLISTPARKRCVAAVWRITSGLIAFLASNGHAIAAFVTYRVTLAWTTNRVTGIRLRFRKTGSSGDRPCVSGRNEVIVACQSGQCRVFPLLPTSRTLPRPYPFLSRFHTGPARRDLHGSWPFPQPPR